MSLIGLGALAAAAGALTPLENLVAAPSGPGRWRQLFPTSAPSARAGAAMAYDAARQMIVLFGGTEDTDTWTWDGLTWNRLSPLSPPARSGASFAYHPPTKTLVLFGGRGAKEYFWGDTWLWNGITWTAVPGDGPPARIDASMAFDPASGGLILFGGFGSSGRFNGAYDDTWMWNGISWVHLLPSSSPLGRSRASLAYHSPMGKLILFGGTGPRGKPTQEATWAWDGMNWSQFPLDRLPPWRSAASMAGAVGGVLLFGGISPSSNAVGWSYLGDTWVLGSTWSEVAQTPTPPPRAGASLVPDPSGNSLLLFGGAGAAGDHPLGDTWIWKFS